MTTEVVEQTSIVQPYTTNENQPCNNGDWAYGERRDCGPNCIRFECSELDIGTCPSIGENIEAEWARNTSNESESPLVFCTYDPTTFDFDDVNEYRDNFGEDDQYNEVVMPTFCFDTSINCPEDPTKETPWKSCPNMLDTGDSGELCRDWRSRNIKIADDAQSTYCQKNSSDPTCSCYTRQNDPVYQIVSPDNPYNDGCWYAPCSKPESYLVPSSLINDDPPCPDDKIICPVINDIISKSVSNIPQSQFQESITCPITATPIPESDGTVTRTYIFIIVIIIVVFFIFIFIIFGIFLIG